MMDKKDAIDYLLYMKHDVLANSPYDVALDTAIEALKETANQPKSNADRIRQMTDEELRRFLNNIADNCSMQDCKECPLNGACDDVPISMQKWLKQEVSEDAGTDG